MRLMRPLPSLIPIMLVLSVGGTAEAQQTPDKVFLPWQKPQPAAKPPANFTEILPWLLPEGGDKAKPRDATGWQAQVAAPKAPVEPVVADPGFEENPLETGGIAPNGLVLKTPLPTRIKTASQEAPAAAVPAPKIKKSIALPGDRPVGQARANEVSPGAAAVAQPSADEAPAVPATLAEPIDADEAFSPEPDQQPLAAGASIESAKPVDRDGTDAAIASPAHATGVAVHAVGEPQSLPIHAGAPVATRVQTAVPAEKKAAADHTVTAQAVTAPSVEAAPAMPQAEEAPPIPDPLPEAVVTPVAKPASPDLPVQRAKELPEAPAAATQATQIENAATAPAGAGPQSKPRAPDRLVDGASVAQQYCFNIADAAKDARYAWQKKTLADIELELNKRIALLDERTAEYQKWLARRDEFIRNAEDNVVKIYAGMKVDAAAVQLALMNEETAAAVLAKLSTRNASAILNEMEPGKASKLTMIITGAAKLKRKKELEKAPATQGADAAPVPGAPAAASEGGRS